jgi:hypothetical protein
MRAGIHCAGTHRQASLIPNQLFYKKVADVKAKNNCDEGLRVLGRGVGIPDLNTFDWEQSALGGTSAVRRKALMALMLRFMGGDDPGSVLTSTLMCDTAT